MNKELYTIFDQSVKTLFTLNINRIRKKSNKKLDDDGKNHHGSLLDWMTTAKIIIVASLTG